MVPLNQKLMFMNYYWIWSIRAKLPLLKFDEGYLVKESVYQLYVILRTNNLLNFIHYP
ncbi:hypothetical protein NARC_170026 [Candidatus Nitrosocosmicus arcticus]|uniref:Uncharacterized protein n=1 Tax=Candidatus Nitrosocosmicus arcticus TaxID=2035267 RepID=A0A557SRQ4_9ARCH|nr:hypothetical protein NARC_170026 [Candidatus Nitrosocosmicus arcticus]